MDEVEDLQVWQQIGADLKAARLAKYGERSGRRVADAAGISEGYLRQIEVGYESKRGHKIPVHPTPFVLRAVSDLVDLDPALILERAGYGPEEGAAPRPAAAEELDTVSIIERMQELLGHLAQRARQGDL